MADKSSRWPQNVSGVFYVDEQCIACDACVHEAPEFFVMNNDDAHAYVQKQPKSDKEIQNCLDALDSCPVDAIGKDGHS